jgi:hypothetical protein
MRQEPALTAALDLRHAVARAPLTGMERDADVVTLHGEQLCCRAADAGVGTSHDRPTSSVPTEPVPLRRRLRHMGRAVWDGAERHPPMGEASHPLAAVSGESSGIGSGSSWTMGTTSWSWSRPRTPTYTLRRRVSPVGQ